SQGIVVHVGQERIVIALRTILEVLVGADNDGSDLLQCAAPLQKARGQVQPRGIRLPVEIRLIQVLNLMSASFRAGQDGGRNLRTVERILVQGRGETVEPLWIRSAA